MENHGELLTLAGELSENHGELLGEFMYMELVKGLLHSIGIKVSLSLGGAILSLVSISN